MSETAIRVQNVTKLYKLYDKPSDRFRESLGLTKKVLHREHYALHDLNFDIKKGECVELLGQMVLANQRFSRLLPEF